jgi:predicted hydrocarbon binding protein
MPKIENPLLLSLYSKVVDQVLSQTANIEEANRRLREIGHDIGSQIYLTTDIVEKTKDTLMTREDVAKLVEIVFRVLYDKRPTSIDMETARGSVRVTDASCIWCQEVHLEGMHGFGYCEVFSGILESVLAFKSVEARVFQEMCRATGADACEWNIRLL